MRCDNRPVQGDSRLWRGGLAGADVVVEETAPEAEALAALLRSEGAAARVVPSTALDRDPRADAAFLDSWTPEVATRVAGLRRGDALVTCLADLLLSRAGERVIGVTGTAGKTTATSFTYQLLRSAGVDAAGPAPGLSGNLWPDGSLLTELDGGRMLVFELTSSHLAFCGTSPRIAVVTSFWPDHVELHGSLEAYASAKEAIVRDQPPGAVLVAPGDGSCERFVRAAHGRVLRLALAGEVDEGAFVHDGVVVARRDGAEHELCAVTDLPVRGRAVANALAAVAAALAAGADPAALAVPLARLRLPPHRVVEVGRFAGVPVLDASMAATPTKGAAALEEFPEASVVLVAGGTVDSSAGPVHTTPEERELLGRACGVIRRVSRQVVIFGTAAGVLAPLLPDATLATGLEEAIERALAASAGARAVVVAPMFPVTPAERDRIAEVVRVRNRT
jgi:UDP-N-acetylmuramoylalanine--D-glutamate ligase